MPLSIPPASPTGEEVEAGREGYIQGELSPLSPLRSALALGMGHGLPHLNSHRIW